MKQIRDSVAGLDVHRDTVVACCRVAGPNRSVEVTKRSFSTTAKGLDELAAWLSEAGVATVAMEATGVYWKPVSSACCAPVIPAAMWRPSGDHVGSKRGRPGALQPR
jgi:transposase